MAAEPPTTKLARGKRAFAAEPAEVVEADARQDASSPQVH